MTTALVDGDSVLYASAFQGEEKFGDIGTRVNLEHAQGNLNRRLETIADTCKASDMIIALSCKSRRYFRHDLYEGYKSHRQGSEKPVLVGPLTEYLIARYKVKFLEGLEADDVLGVCATNGRYEDPVVVSTDKDLRQIPGRHLNPDKISRGIKDITPEQGDRFHLFQTLTGDTTDGYPGCPRIGPVKAEKILNTDCSWSSVVAAFIRAKKTEEDALVQARVAKILRAEDWDGVNRKVKLWSPR